MPGQSDTHHNTGGRIQFGAVKIVTRPDGNFDSSARYYSAIGRYRDRTASEWRTEGPYFVTPTDRSHAAGHWHGRAGALGWRRIGQATTRVAWRGKGYWLSHSSTLVLLCVSVVRLSTGVYRLLTYGVEFAPWPGRRQIDVYTLDPSTHTAVHSHVLPLTGQMQIGSTVRFPINADFDVSGLGLLDGMLSHYLRVHDDLMGVSLFSPLAATPYDSITMARSLYSAQFGQGTHNLLHLDNAVWSLDGSLLAVERAEAHTLVLSNEHLPWGGTTYATRDLSVSGACRLVRYRRVVLSQTVSEWRREVLVDNIGPYSFTAHHHNPPPGMGGSFARTAQGVVNQIYADFLDGAGWVIDRASSRGIHTGDTVAATGTGISIVVPDHDEGPWTSGTWALELRRLGQIVDSVDLGVNPGLMADVEINAIVDWLKFAANRNMAVCRHFGHGTVFAPSNHPNWFAATNRVSVVADFKAQTIAYQSGHFGGMISLSD